MTDAPAPDASPRKPLTLKGAALLLFIFGVVPFGLLAVLWKDRCTTAPQAEVASPDGAFQVTTYLTTCGGTLKPATEVRIEALRSPEARNVVETLLVYQGEDAPVVTWKGASQLEVVYPRGVEVVTRRPRYESLAIELKEKP